MFLLFECYDGLCVMHAAHARRVEALPQARPQRHRTRRRSPPQRASDAAHEPRITPVDEQQGRDPAQFALAGRRRRAASRGTRTRSRSHRRGGECPRRPSAATMRASHTLRASATSSAPAPPCPCSRAAPNGEAASMSERCASLATSERCAATMPPCIQEHVRHGSISARRLAAAVTRRARARACFSRTALRRCQAVALSLRRTAGRRARGGNSSKE